MIAKNTVFFLFAKVLKVIWDNTLGKFCCVKVGDECSAECFYAEMPILALQSLYTKTKEEIKKFESIDPKELAEGKFFGMRYTEEVKLDHVTMKNNLYNRRVQIEGVINDHLRYLHGEECLNNEFESRDFRQKLKYLAHT